MIDIDDIRSRFGQAAEFLDERGRRLFAANEALAHGNGGVMATAAGLVWRAAPSLVAFVNFALPAIR